MNALSDLMNQLNNDERIEALSLGKAEGTGGLMGKPLPDHPFLGQLLTVEQAAPLLEGWSVESDYGRGRAYAMYVWTTRRVGAVIRFEGANMMIWLPRNPVADIPVMAGDGN